MSIPRFLLAPEVRRLALASLGWRGLVAGFALALGVALGYGVHLIHAVAVAETESAARRLAGEADRVVRAVAAAGLDEGLYPVLAARPEVAVASPVLEIEAKVPARPRDRWERLQVLGIDIFRAGEIQPALAALDAPREMLRPDRIFLNPAALAWLGLGACPNAAGGRVFGRLPCREGSGQGTGQGAGQGDTVILQSGVGEVVLRVAGSVDLPGPPLGVMDIAGAQAAFGLLGRLSRIELRFRSGLDPERAAADLERLLPPGARIEAPAAQSRQAGEYSRAYRVNLDVLALVALFTGGLLVFSSQSLAVLRRRRQLALLRTLGFSRREILALLLAEALILGLAGGALGVGLGQMLARLLLQVSGADLGGIYFQGLAVQAIRVEWGAATAFMGLGLAAALAGSLLPALEAARAPPARALRAGDEEEGFSRRYSPYPGMALLALGGLAAFLPSLGRLPVFGYLSVAFFLLGTIALLPQAGAGLLGLAARLPLERRVLTGLALAQLRGAAGQVSLSLAPLVASVAVAAAMAIMVGSFRTSLESWLDRLLPADLYLRAGAAGDSAFLPPAVQAELAARPGVGSIEFRRSLILTLAPERPPVTLLARDVDAWAPDRTLPLVGAWKIPEGGLPGAWISEALADLHGWAVGQRVTLPLGSRRLAVEIAGIWRDYARSGGAIVVERSAYAAATGDTAANEAVIRVASGANPAAVARELAAGFAPGTVAVESPGELKRISFSLFDRTFAATYALEGAAMAVGLAGLSASFAALVLARRREFGVLRHLGLSRREIGIMLACQGAFLALAALAVGFTLSGVLGWILIEVINRQSFHWSMDYLVPWLPLGLFGLAVAGLAAGTAALSGGLAMRREAALAVREDW